MKLKQKKQNRFYTASIEVLNKPDTRVAMNLAHFNNTI